MANSYYYFVAVLFLILFLKRFYNQSNKKSPPSPFALPIIGHFYLIKTPLYLSLASLLSEYGPILSLRLGCRSFLVVSSPSLVKECFTKNDMTFAHRPNTIAGDHLTYNYKLYPMAPYGHLWKILRRLTVVELFSKTILQKSATIREEEIQTVSRILFKASKNGPQKVDLRYFIASFTSNVAMRQVAGKRYIKEEDAGTEIAKKNIQNFRSTFAAGLQMNVCDFFPILKLFGYKGLEKKIISVQEKRNDFLQRMLDEFRQQIASTNSSASMNKENNAILIQTLLSLQESEPDFYTDDLIKSLLLIMCVAGTFPPNVAIEWGMSLLLTNPKELHKLRTEIDNIVGQERLLNESDLGKLPYLHCVVNETLRLYPPLPLLLPHYSSEDSVVGGYDIPKGTIILVNAWAMHRDKKLWEEPNKFNPERFQALKLDRDGFKFIPFGMGRRACAGEIMGLRTILLALGALVQCFDWKMNEDDDLKIGFLMQKAKPLEAVCIPRQLHFLSHL